eukprot:CAMPEP_0198334406 /NCGR_PEP_ID=MMETSP1450-20131203/19588_1 /TAXON_ID=753684 ORGANISM="Madagascaria erythrocladiodes, Strain CCMP3234" /NCGR_SAMPLE_ID=MMETSP1450 /ASSEMBLY_ACC=CAM_ASM_001115 /LENGTH=700 /DNA_ID=CAMNT_0044038993 /DNA_START=96 /DNA_END=2194 /DNA_ORIENTATION=-
MCRACAGSPRTLRWLSGAAMFLLLVPAGWLVTIAIQLGFLTSSEQWSDESDGGSSQAAVLRLVFASWTVELVQSFVLNVLLPFCAYLTVVRSGASGGGGGALRTAALLTATCATAVQVASGVTRLAVDTIFGFLGGAVVAWMSIVASWVAAAFGVLVYVVPLLVMASTLQSTMASAAHSGAASPLLRPTERAAVDRAFSEQRRLRVAAQAAALVLGLPILVSLGSGISLLVETADLPNEDSVAPGFYLVTGVLLLVRDVVLELALVVLVGTSLRARAPWRPRRLLIALLLSICLATDISRDVPRILPFALNSEDGGVQVTTLLLAARAVINAMLHLPLVATLLLLIHRVAPTFVVAARSPSSGGAVNESAGSGGSSTGRSTDPAALGGDRGIDIYDYAADAATASAGSTPPPGIVSTFIIDDADIRRTKLIGRGAYGEVWKCTWRGTDVAVKVTSRGVRDDGAIGAEAKMLTTIRAHPNVVTFFGCVVEPRVALVTRWYANGSLDRVLYDARIAISPSQQQRWWLGIASGLAHLHSHDVIHRDLAARNVLLDEHDSACITDFGLSRVLVADDADGGSGLHEATTRTSVGPVCWMAPEQLRTRAYSKASDVYAFGCTLFEIVERQPPWKNVALSMAIHYTISGERPPRRRKRWPPTVYALADRCWREDAAARPTALVCCSVLGGDGDAGEDAAQRGGGGGG